MSQVITHNKQPHAKMEALKLALHIIGFPSVLLGIVWNFDNIKGSIVAILGIIYLSVQLVFLVDRLIDVRAIRKINRWREEQKARSEGWK